MLEKGETTFPPQVFSDHFSTPLLPHRHLGRSSRQAGAMWALGRWWESGGHQSKALECLQEKMFSTFRGKWLGVGSLLRLLQRGSISWAFHALGVPQAAAGEQQDGAVSVHVCVQA